MLGKGIGMAALIGAVVVVQWTTLWRQTYDEEPKEFKHQRVFYDEKEARRFYDHRPSGLFECVNSLTAMPGFCEVKDVELKIQAREPVHGRKNEK